MAERRTVADPWRLEVLNSEGRYAAVIELGEPMLELEASMDRRGRVCYQLAMAYLQMGQLDLGGAVLADAKAHFEALGDAPMVAECIATEAGLAVTRQRPDAVQVAIEALDACRRLDPIPPALDSRALNYLASAYVADGEWRKATEVYEEAIARAGPVVDMRRRARLFNDAAIAYRELGRLERAMDRAVKARALFELLRDTVSLARLHNNLGLICISRGDLAGARGHLEHSLELCDEGGVEFGRSHVLLSLCELEIVEQRPARAFEFARQALACAERVGEVASEAEAHLWLGRVAESLSQPQTADAEFELAIELFGRLGGRRGLLRCHHSYAQVLEARGDLRRAYVHMSATQSLARRV